MGLFDLFKPKLSISATNTNLLPKDERIAECPYCHKKLAKVPAAKTKCPHCNKYMYVRASPDKIKAVVTEEEADKIDEEWSLIAEMDTPSLTDLPEYKKEQEILRKRFGYEPSDDDVRWGVLNNRLVEHAQTWSWGLYCNDKLEIARMLHRQMKLKDALITYLEVCYLDLNGPMNMGGIQHDKTFLKEYPPFDPGRGLAFVAPGIVDFIKKIMTALNLSSDEIGNIFIPHNQRIYLSLNLPVQPEIAWQKLQDHFVGFNPSERKNVCPYCGEVPEARIVREKNCAKCGNPIFVNTTQGLYQTDYLTKTQLNIVNALNMVVLRDVTPGIFWREKKALSDEFHIKGTFQDASDGDTLWRILNTKLLEYVKLGNLNMIQECYASMATFLSHEGKNSIHLQKEQKKAYLRYLSSFYPKQTRLTIEVPGYECEICKQQEGQTLTLAEAVKEMPLPCSGCTSYINGGQFSYCGCVYIVNPSNYTSATKDF